jgi:hypothetical protein
MPERPLDGRPIERTGESRQERWIFDSLLSSWEDQPNDSLVYMQIARGEVSNTVLISGGAGANTTGLAFESWMFPGDVLTSAEVSITTAEKGIIIFDGKRGRTPVWRINTSYAAILKFRHGPCVQKSNNQNRKRSAYGCGLNSAVVRMVIQ